MYIYLGLKFRLAIEPSYNQQLGYFYLAQDQFETRSGLTLPSLLLVSLFPVVVGGAWQLGTFSLANDTHYLGVAAFRILHKDGEIGSSEIAGQDLGQLGKGKCCSFVT